MSKEEDNNTIVGRLFTSSHRFDATPPYCLVSSCWSSIPRSGIGRRHLAEVG
jgi:hypothetical protein